MEKERQAQLERLYAEAQTALQQKQWGKAIRLGAEIQSLEPGYRDIEKLRSVAKTGLARQRFWDALRTLVRIVKRLWVFLT